MVEIHEDKVIKRVPSDVGLVAEKYRALHKISAGADFRAPVVLGIDGKNMTIALERIHDIESSRVAYREFMSAAEPSNHSLKLFERIGKSLAYIHSTLYCDMRCKVWKPSRLFASAVEDYGFTESLWPENEPLVQLHGDYGFANVMVRGLDQANPEIVIIDPCSDGYSCAYDWAQGPRYLDLAKMLLSLEGKVPYTYQYCIRNKRVCQLQGAFIKGYEAIYGRNLNLSLCYAYAYALGVCYFSARYPVSGGLRKTVLYNRRLRKNFPLDVKVENYNLGR